MLNEHQICSSWGEPTRLAGRFWQEHNQESAKRGIQLRMLVFPSGTARRSPDSQGRLTALRAKSFSGIK